MHLLPACSSGQTRAPAARQRAWASNVHQRHHVGPAGPRTLIQRGHQDLCSPAQVAHTADTHQGVEAATAPHAATPSRSLSTPALTSVIARSTRQLGDLRGLWNIATLLGTAFWDNEMAPLLSETETQAMETILGTLRMRLYGVQLTFQLFMMHFVYFDSTVSVIMRTTEAPTASPLSRQHKDSSNGVRSSQGSGAVPPGLPGPWTHQLKAVSQWNSIWRSLLKLPVQLVLGESKADQQVVGTAVVQLRLSGQELKNAIGCDVDKNVIIISNVAVSPEWQGRGIGRRIMQAAEEAAIDIFCRPLNQTSLPTTSPMDAAINHALAGSSNADMESVESARFEESAADMGSSMDSSSESGYGSFAAWWQSQAPKYAVLVVYKDNLRARALYQSCGWQEAPEWKDKVWEAEASRGRPGGRPRRLLYYKELKV